MAEASNKRCKGSGSCAALHSEESIIPAERPSVDRVYPTGMGLRPKACPRPQSATVSTTRDDRPVQGPVDRCLTIVRAMSTDTADDDRENPVEPIETSVGALNNSTSDPDESRLEPRPAQSARRNRAQTGWDVLPLVPKCGCLASCAALPVIAPGGGTLSDWLMTILRTYAFIMICMSYMVSRSGQSAGTSSAW